MDNHPILPQRLRRGDEVRVVSFGLSLRGASDVQRKICNATLASLGLRVSFAQHVDISDDFDTSPVELRLRDLHEAVGDPNVKLILSGLGGMNAAQLLRGIDWGMLKQNPKLFSGFSDMATLVNAIYARTDIVTYYGPFYGTFGMKKGAEYMLRAFETCLFSSAPFDVSPAPSWSDDSWWVNQEDRHFRPNPGPLVINKGEASGRLVGGHLTSLAMLFGTEYLPSLMGTILMIEENSEVRPRSFDRLLQCLLHQSGFNGVRALLIGRFTAATKITDEVLVRIVTNYPELARIPVIANLSFGHTYPQFTFPIGGNATVSASDRSVNFTILNH